MRAAAMGEEKRAQLARARASQQDRARPEAIAKVHAGGKLTARERLGVLFDPGSQVEFGGIAAADASGNWIPEAGGVDRVGRIAGQTVIASSTDYTDHGGGYGAARLERLMGLAYEHCWPLVLFVDGGGSRARHPRVGLGHTEITGPLGRFQLFDGMAELSGRVPTVAVVSGPAFAGHASLAAFSDCVISTPGSSIGMGGPPMVEAAFGITVTANELAGAEMQAQRGGIELLAANEREAIAAARRYLSYLRDEPSGAAAADANGLARLVPDQGPYRMVPVIEALVDEGSFFELRGAFAASVRTGFARVAGRALGVVASEPNVRGGRVDEDAATKIARFVEICDRYALPILALVDSEGCVRAGATGTQMGTQTGDGAAPGVSRAHMRPIMVHQHRTTPLIGVTVRKARDLSLAIFCGPANARSIPLLHVAWPGVEVGRVDGYTSLRNPNVYDDIIDPGETRERVAYMLGCLPPLADRCQRQRSLARSGPIDTW